MPSRIESWQRPLQDIQRELRRAIGAPAGLLSALAGIVRVRLQQVDGPGHDTPACQKALYAVRRAVEANLQDARLNGDAIRALERALPGPLPDEGTPAQNARAAQQEHQTAPSQTPPPAAGRLKPCYAKAFKSYQQALRACPDLSGERAIYRHITEHGCEAYEGERVPRYETWRRYVRGGRRLTEPHDAPTPRAGREHGKRIVRADQI